MNIFVDQEIYITSKNNNNYYIITKMMTMKAKINHFNLPKFKF